MNPFDAKPARRLPSDSDTAPRVGIVRGLPNTYELDAFGNTYSTNPIAVDRPAYIVRAESIPFVMPPPVPMYDPSMGPPVYWRP